VTRAVADARRPDWCRLSSLGATAIGRNAAAAADVGLAREAALRLPNEPSSPAILRPQYIPTTHVLTTTFRRDCRESRQSRRPLHTDCAYCHTTFGAFGGTVQVTVTTGGVPLAKSP
jgi:hypothetical protein